MTDDHDPLKQELTGRNPGNPLPKSKGRVTLDPGIWDRLHATPYGRFDRVIAPDAPADPSKVRERRAWTPPPREALPNDGRPPRASACAASCALLTRRRAPPCVALSRQVSRVPFEHYNITTGKAVLDRELPRGKRMDCAMRDMRTSKIFNEMDPVKPFAGFPPEYM